MNDSAISTVATAAITNASGAAGPAAPTTSVMLKAAVTVGATTARESPRASSRVRRLISTAIDPWCRPRPDPVTVSHLDHSSPHHERRHVRIGNQAAADIGQRLINDRDPLLGLGLGQRQGRRELEHVAAQADIEQHGTELPGPIDDLGGRRDRDWLARGPIADKLDADRQSTAAHLTDHRLTRGERAQRAGEPLTQSGGALDETLGGDRTQHGAAGRGRDRIAGRGQQRERGCVVHDRARPDERRQRQATAEPLAEDHQIRLQSLVLEAVHPAAAREPGLDLIDDELDAVAAAALLYGGEETLWRHDDAGVGDQRLDEDTGPLLRRTGGRELVIQ